LDNERYNIIPSFIEKKNRKQQQKTKRLIALEINNKKNETCPPPYPSLQQKTKRLIALEINNKKMKLAHPPTPPFKKKIFTK